MNNQSDRCVFFTCSASERHYNYVMESQRRNRMEYEAMQLLVIEHVHPSQFTCLPPSPEAIKTKAWLLGIECKKYGF